MNLFQQIFQLREQVFTLLGEHIQLTLTAVALAVAVGLPLGILISHYANFSKPVLGFANVVQSIPSMALLGFAIPFLGIGVLPSVLAVALYALLPIIKNTYTGLVNINCATLEAAEGIGMTKRQILFRVQFPQALPMIMSGIRISAVNSVGLMTMAAYVGAGGLGFLVYSGIRTLNNAQTLAGAIPACLLALFIDYFFGLVEKLVTPISLHLTPSSDILKIKKSHRRQIIAFAAICLAVVTLFTTTVLKVEKKPDIVVGSKDYTEQIILNCMVADVIEGNLDLVVGRKMALGGSQICFTALTNGEIDIYTEYSGTMFTNLLKHDPIADKQKVYETIRDELAQQYDITALKMMNYNNTFTLALRPETVEKYNLKTLSDLARVSDQLVLGAELEFFDRQDGLAGLHDHYGLTFGQELGVVGSNRYTALASGSCDVINAYSTDGLLKKFGLVCMEDDKNFFVPYFATPMVRNDVIDRYPQIVPYIEALGNALSEEIMIELNYKVDELQMKPEDVARQFVVENNLASFG